MNTLLCNNSINNCSLQIPTRGPNSICQPRSKTASKLSSTKISSMHSLRRTPVSSCKAVSNSWCSAWVVSQCHSQVHLKTRHFLRICTFSKSRFQLTKPKPNSLRFSANRKLLYPLQTILSPGLCKEAALQVSMGAFLPNFREATNRTRLRKSFSGTDLSRILYQVGFSLLVSLPRYKIISLQINRLSKPPMDSTSSD